MMLNCYIFSHGSKRHLDLETLERIDSQKMHQVYDRWPDIAQEQFDSGFEPLESHNLEHIVFAGMGGSGAIGNLFASILSKTGMHVDVVKGYLLPKTVDSDSLVVTTSISGNTAETLTVLDSVRKTGCKTVSFSSGGTMQEYCQRHDMPARSIPMYHSPRASFTSFLYSMLNVLRPVLPISDSDVTESISGMRELQKRISSNSPAEGNDSLELAGWLSDIPVIYYPSGLEAAAIRFKNSLQENAKMHVISGDIIETCHNGIVSWSAPSEMRPVLVRGADDYAKTQERWEILKEFFADRKVDFREVFSAEGGILTKLTNLVYLFDYATIYRAVLSGADPTPIGAIDFVKNRL